MTPPASPFEERQQGVGDPEPPEQNALAERLRICSRLLSTAADELEALERAELTKWRELAEARAALVRELRPEREEEDPPIGVDPADLPVSAEVASVVGEVFEVLDAREQAERRMQDTWSSLEEDALKAMHAGGGIAALRSGRYPSHLPADARLDLRF